MCILCETCFFAAVFVYFMMDASVNSDTTLNASTFLNSFSKYSSDANTSNECSIVPVPADPLSVAVNELMDFKAQNNTTLKSTVDLANLLNNKPNAHVKLPTNVSELKRNAHMRFSRQFVLICDCKKLCDENGCCTVCKKQNKKGKSNFIVKIPIKQQIYELLNRNLEVIVSYMHREKNDVISDIDDGMVFKRLSEENPDTKILSFTINSDGAPVYNSNNVSMWPVQLIANFMPPHIRYKQSNILLSSLYISKEKPDLNDLFYLLAEEIETLQRKKITFWYNEKVYKCIPVVMIAVFDLPARAMASGLKLFNGTNSCVYCTHHGTKVKDHLGMNYVRYVKIKPDPLKRTHEGVIAAIADLNTKSSPNHPYGIVDIPPMILFPKFDLTKGFAIDYMHNSALNVTKLLIDFWMGCHRLSKKSKYFNALPVKSRKLLNKRLVSLKPCSYITRKPRSLDERSYFKATEYRYLLLFYLRYALIGLLDHNRVKHFEKFSAAVYILLKSDITREDIEEARVMLTNFADDFEKFYGIEAVTMNIHLVRHYVDSVIELGPLWSYSMFCYEKHIGHLKKSVVNPTDALETWGLTYNSNNSFRPLMMFNIS